MCIIEKKYNETASQYNMNQLQCSPLQLTNLHLYYMYIQIHFEDLNLSSNMQWLLFHKGYLLHFCLYKEPTLPV